MNNPEFNETPTDDTFDLRQYAFLLWHWAWLIALMAVLAAGSAYLFSKSQTPIYQASTTVMVNSAPSSQSTDYSSILASQNLTTTYAQMITNQPVLKAVAQRLGLGADKLGTISVASVRDTQLINISVSLPDPVLAAKVANSIAEVFAAQILDMQSARYTASSETIKAQMVSMDGQIKDLTAQIAITTDKTEQARLEDKLAQYRDIYSRLLLSYENVRLTEAQTISSITQVDPAAVPTTPVSPKTTQNTLLAGLVGALLATGAILLVDALDDTIRDPEVLLKKYHLPILGVIAHHEQVEGQPVTQRAPRSPVSEAFRSLRTNVKYVSVDKPLRTILVTSPTPSDGKSTITTNLAVVLAQGGSKVFVLDADLRRPVIHRLLGTHNRIGLTSLFVQPTVDLNGSVQHVQKTENISVISSGVLPPNPAELLGSRKMGEILDFILTQCDIVLLDTPPVLSVTDSVVLAPSVDGVLLVIKPGTTKQAAFKQALTQLNQVGANLLGVVVNEVGASGRYTNYYYRKYYQDHYGYSEIDPGKRRPKIFRLFSKRGKHVEREQAGESAPTENQKATEMKEN